MSGSLKDGFDSAANPSIEKAQKDYPKPISVRFSDEERSELERKAGDLTLSAYIRSRCVGETAPAHRTRGKRPVKDHEALGRVLGALGQSCLSNNLNQLAKAVNAGTLGLPDDSEAALLAAVDDISSIRETLIMALGLQDGPS